MLYFKLSRKLKEELLTYGASQQVEVCGLLGGRFTESMGKSGVFGKVHPDSVIATHFYPINNIAPNPVALAVMDPKQLFAAQKDIFSREDHMVGWFHSHPFNLGIPSQKDKDMIADEFHWLIYGGQDKTIRTWFPESLKEPKSFKPTILLED